MSEPVPPKPLPTAYQLFQHLNKERILKENRDTTDANLAQLLAVEWAFLSNKDKRVRLLPEIVG